MCLPAGILAQSGAASDSRYAATDTALVSHVFVGGRPDTIRVWLERHDIYHLEVYGRGAKVAIKPAGRAGAPDPSPRVTWAFVEPRVRAWRQNRLEVGVLGRLAKGNVSQSSNDPAYVVAGLWMAYRLSGEPGAAGLAFRGSSVVGTLVSANVGSSTLGQIAIGLVGRL